VDVLGPLALHVDGRPVDVPGARRRALLALLALQTGRAVSTERLVEELWPDEPPENAVQALYNHVSRLRGHLGARAERLERHASGYRLTLLPDELDADAARRLARAASAKGTSPAVAADLLGRALRLWRGTALGEFASVPLLAVEAVALEELRLRLVDDLVEARLALGDRTVIVDAAAAVAASPLRERSAMLHVRALAQDGRTADAMAAAQAYRHRLAEETGLDPGPELADLEQRVAAGHAAPARAEAASAVPRRARPDGPMVGRQHERDEVLRLLGRHGTVTVTGPGGVGKSRLAYDVAAEPESLGEVVVVELAAVDRAERVCAAVASTVGLRTGDEVDAAEVATALADRQLLLLLDNCEHVVEACRELVLAVRRTAPGVRVLATSRTTLHVDDEYVVRLQPLPVPRDASDLDALRRHPAVRAFVEHARRLRAGYDLAPEDAADLVEVLRRLDGLPLGIELAARQVAVMPVRAVRDRLDRALDLATGRRAAEDQRQRTLRATIDSSYRLLGAREQRLLRALAPFPGGVDLATVEVLAEDVGADPDPLDLLHHLVDSSLVIADAGTGRYRLLFTVRAFLLDQLVALDELAEAELRFVDRCATVAREIGMRMFGREEAATDRRLRAELDNLRAARDIAAASGRPDARVSITVEVNQVAV
jgi:predicted ATPase/DNA-binding SARP family transcriptional activator